MAEVLDRAAREVGSAFADQPEVEAPVRETLGITYLALGLPDEAAPHLRTALEMRQRLYGSDHPKTIAAMASQAGWLYEKGRLAASEALGDVRVLTAHIAEISTHTTSPVHFAIRRVRDGGRIAGF